MSDFIGMDREGEGPDYDSRFCPEWCYGEMRESCGGCDFYNEEGEPINE